MRLRACLKIAPGHAAVLLAGGLGAGALRAAPAEPEAYEREIRPLLEKYCYDCHGDGMKKGEVSLDSWKSTEEALGDKTAWERVINVLERGEMPPKKKKQPTEAERERLGRWIERTPLDGDCDAPDPGRVTLRRLNRAEYNNTVRDLLGVDFKPAADFPVDDSGFGFDNIGDALSIPPLLLEKYLAAADKIVDAALGLNEAGAPEKRRYPIDQLEVGYNAKQRGDGWVGLNTIEEDDLAITLERAVPAEYLARVRAYARQDAERPMDITFLVDQKPARVAQVGTNAAAAEIYEARVTVPAGKHRVRMAVRRIKDGLPEAEALRWKSGKEQQGMVFVEWLELEGPFPLTDAAPRIVLPGAGEGGEGARRFLGQFASQAFRRPAAEAEVSRLLGLASRAWERGNSHAAGLAVAMKAALVSPHFLFRGELQPEPDNPRAVHPVNEYALASRLSYFLWSTLPDAELIGHARAGTLRANLTAQVRRMLADGRARSLVDNFAGQWLQFRNVSQLTPHDGTFTDFNEPLREAMRRETELFFENVLREDRSVMEFLTADYTFVNGRLAKHYGISGVEGPDFRRVPLAGTPRRGVLGHASVLALTSNPTRTSPVKRGKWVLETLLNAPPPPPPPGVSELQDEGKELTGTLRQRLEQHRADALCASCHARMDPIGFGLENFDAIGAWRELDRKEPIDAAGELMTGEKFEGPLELTRILSEEKREQYLRCLAEKMLTYALGRGVESHDRCAVREIVAALEKNDGKFSALVLAITQSAPFQMRRGEAGTRAVAANE